MIAADEIAVAPVDKELIFVGENRKKKIKINPADDETAIPLFSQTLVSIPVAAAVPGGINLGINPVLTTTGSSSLLESTREEVLAFKSTRQRAESHANVKDVTCDSFSLVHFAAIGVTQDLALMDIYGYKASVYIPGKVVGGKFIVKKIVGKALDEKLLELTARIKVFDKGVDPVLASALLDSKEWKAFRGYFVNAKVGEVMNKAGKLLGCLKGTKIHLSDIYKKSDRPSRAGFILESTGVVFAPNETPDHIDSTQPLNDSISNLRPLDKSGQSSNRIFIQNSTYSTTFTGNLLPTHPTLRSIKLTDTGMVNVGKGLWYKFVDPRPIISVGYMGLCWDID